LLNTKKAQKMEYFLVPLKYHSNMIATYCCF